MRVRLSHYAYEVSANQTDNTFTRIYAYHNTRIIFVMTRSIKSKVPRLILLIPSKIKNVQVLRVLLINRKFIVPKMAKKST